MPDSELNIFPIRDSKPFKPLEAHLGTAKVATGIRVQSGRLEMLCWFGSVTNLNSEAFSTAIISVRLRSRSPITVVVDTFLGEVFRAQLANEVWSIQGIAVLDHSKKDGFWYAVDFDLTTLWISD